VLFCKQWRYGIRGAILPFGRQGEGKHDTRHGCAAGHAGPADTQGAVAGALHGWGITNRIQEMSRDAFQVGQGSLYPALHRYETRVRVTSYWRTTENNRIARYYDLTAAAEGRRSVK